MQTNLQCENLSSETLSYLLDSLTCTYNLLDSEFYYLGKYNS